MKTIAKFFAVAALATAAGAPVIAQDALEGAVKARQAHMQLLSFNLGTLGGMARGNAEFDAAAAQAAADNLVTLSMMNQMPYWPAGSDSESVAGSRALPAIWTDLAGVGAKGADFAAAAAAMQAAAGSLEGVQGAMGALGASCSGCHQAYRQPNN